MRKFVAATLFGALMFGAGAYVQGVGDSQEADARKVSQANWDRETASSGDIKTIWLEGGKLVELRSALDYAEWCGGGLEIEVSWEDPEIVSGGCDQ